MKSNTRYFSNAVRVLAEVLFGDPRKRQKGEPPALLRPPPLPCPEERRGGEPHPPSRQPPAPENWRWQALKWLSLLIAAAAFLAVSAPSPALIGEKTVFDKIDSFRPFDACTDGGPTRSYNVSAIRVEMTLNRFGDHDPGAYMYVLDDNIQAVRDQEQRALPDRVSTGLRKDPIQPLVIRANLGECLVITFTNRLSDGPAAFHVQGLPYTAENAGGAVGNNPDTFAPAGGSVVYRIPLPDDPAAERAYYVRDGAADRRRVSHGLFGAIVAEPKGSQYLDPESGEPFLGNNWEAIIKVPGGTSFREFVLLYHEVGDENFEGILDRFNQPLDQQDEFDIYRPAGRAINYRSEPYLNRLRLRNEESQGYGSYMFGDPATPIPRSYLGEPTKTRLLHGGSEVFHVHHLHGGADRWRRNPKADPSNDISGGLDKSPVQNAAVIHLDSQSIGPGASYNLEHECGAGGCQQAAADFLFHCHIQHHYLAGMWAFWRVFDTLQGDDAGETPLAVVPELFANPNVKPPKKAVHAHELLGKTIDGKRLVAAVNDPATERPLTDFIESQLPPQGVRLDDNDATVWDWQRRETAQGPVYLGEPETVQQWANYASPTPGERPEILFNPNNGRYTWPLLRPHLGQRPPFSANGHSGAPWLGEKVTQNRLDGLCLGSAPQNPGARDRFYPITSITLPIQVAKDHFIDNPADPLNPILVPGEDPQGMIYVLNEEKNAVEGGGANNPLRRPLVLRSNAGDCTRILFTQELEAAFGPEAKNNMHTHFVQFDPQASDGVITGMSYEQSVFPYRLENRTLTQSAGAGDTIISVTNLARLRTGIWLGVGLGEGMCPGPFAPDARPCTEIRKIAAIDAAASTVTLDRPLDLGHEPGEHVGVEFVQYLWYSDIDSGTVFWHDHVNLGSWFHGLFGAHIVEPRGATYHDPATGDEVRSGTVVDIRAPVNSSVGNGVQGSFREFMAFVHNGSPATGGQNAGGTINLRAEPFDARLPPNVPLGTPSLMFSSVFHGDPETPLPRAYVGDPFVLRGLGLVERIGGIRITGHRFHNERLNADSAMSDTIPFGISERFDMILEGGAGGTAGMPGDYLYYSSLGRDFAAGAWGILRVHDTEQPDLERLPDHPVGDGAGIPVENVTGDPPLPAAGPGQPCPLDAPLRRYDIEINNSDIVIRNSPLLSFGGTVYALLGQSGAQTREPLVLRVNHGECLELALTNLLGDPAGISVGKLPFDPQGSSGAAIGFNPDSSTQPGATRTYRFYADKELGAGFGLNLANPLLAAEGAFAAVVVEPEGAEYRDPDTGAPIRTGVQADIVSPTGAFPKFREFVALFHDDDDKIGANKMPYPTAVEKMAGISYSAEPLSDRGLLANPSQVFSSARGEPRHVVNLLDGNPVMFRVAEPWGEQAHVFALEGHRFPQDPDMEGSEQLFSNLLVPGVAFDAPLIGGAGGDIGGNADYLFMDQRTPFTEAGLWGLLRVGASGRPVPPPPPPPPAPLFTDSVEITKAKLGTSLAVVGTVTQDTNSGRFAPTVALFSGNKSEGGSCTGTKIRDVKVKVNKRKGIGQWKLRIGKKRLLREGFALPTTVCAQSALGGGAGDRNVD